MFNPSVVLGSIMAASFAAGATALLLTGPSLEPRVVNVSEFHVAGGGCGLDRGLYLAREEDDLPEPCRDVLHLPEGAAIIVDQSYDPDAGKMMLDPTIGTTLALRAD